MWYMTACKISVSHSFLNWIKNEMIFFHISELVLPTLKAPYSSKNRHLIIQERFDKLTYGISTIIKCST